MRYIIDGYNFLFCLDNEDFAVNLERSRTALLDFLHEHAAHLSILVVFDSSKENSEPVPFQQFHEGIEVVFSPKGQCADKYILELLSWDSRGKVLVTMDKHLARHVAYIDGKTISINNFLALFKKKRAKETKLLVECPKEIERLEKIFEERLKNS